MDKSVSGYIQELIDDIEKEDHSIKLIQHYLLYTVKHMHLLSEKIERLEENQQQIFETALTQNNAIEELAKMVHKLGKDFLALKGDPEN